MITIEKLAAAIRDRLGHPPAQARTEAQRVLDHFGFRTRIIDNAILPTDRKLFYELHDAGLLRSFWETVLLMNGRSWRIFYWELDEAGLGHVLGSRKAEDEPLYRSLPPEAWRRSRAAT